MRRPICENATIDTNSVRIDDSLVVISAITVIALAYINYRVIKIVGTNDIQLVLMLIFLKLSLISNCIFYSFQSSISGGKLCYANEYYYCMNAVFVPSGAEFLSVAVLLNISKWIYFTLYVRALGDEESDKDWTVDLARQKNHLNIGTAVISSAILTTSIIYFLKGCDPMYTSEDTYDTFTESVLNPTNRFLGITYFLLALMFFTVAICFLHSIKRYHVDFYS